MKNTNRTKEVIDTQRPKELPGTLNVLTILTFIGCGFSYIFGILGYIFTNNASEKIEKMSQAGASQNQIDMFMKSADNRSLLLISSLVFTTLCLISAFQMRKLKRLGYYLYLIGEIAPIVVSAGLFGGLSGSSSNAAMTIIGVIIGIGVPIVFVILYSTQLKYLENK